MDSQITKSIGGIDPEQWNLLNTDNSPFLRHEFLYALEKHEAVGERFGWLPRFILTYDKNRNLSGALPLYEKDNSYGELVFDWAWADAFHRQGIPYYPKLVSAIPYTPATGKRLLTCQGDNKTAELLVRTALDYAKRNNYSSLHYLFMQSEQLGLLERNQFMTRQDVQYHWINNNYDSFTDFLSQLRNNKRKKIKQERRKVKEQGIELTILHGNELTTQQWADVHRFYCSTFIRKSGYPTFSQSLFEDIAQSMGEQIVIVLASLNGKNIAAAINFRSHDCLYGRHWGCDAEYDGLHFEACYYQGIEYAIKHGLKRYEPGAQGEYKMSRGFLPVITRSAHWIANPDFRDAISDFLSRETRAIHAYHRQLMDSTPYRTSDDTNRTALAG